jgi:hypothetical protein
MTQPSPSSSADRAESSRRVFLQTSGKAAAATALVGSMVPRVHAAEDNTIRLALIGWTPSATTNPATKPSEPGCPTWPTSWGGPRSIRETSPTGIKPMHPLFQWCPGLDQMDYDTPPPVQADQHGRYPCPSPGYRRRGVSRGQKG